MRLSLYISIQNGVIHTQACAWVDLVTPCTIHFTFSSSREVGWGVEGGVHTSLTPHHMGDWWHVFGHFWMPYNSNGIYKETTHLSLHGFRYGFGHFDAMQQWIRYDGQHYLS
jgi:hypothetical protein